MNSKPTSSHRRTPACRNDDFAAAEEARIHGKRAGTKQDQREGHRSQVKFRECIDVPVSGAEKKSDTADEVAESCDCAGEGRQESNDDHKTHNDCEQSKRPDGRCGLVGAS